MTLTAYLIACALVAANPEPMIRTGEVRYDVPMAEDRVPERFRLEAHRFTFEEEPLPAASTPTRARPRTPSPPGASPSASRRWHTLGA